MFAVIGTAVRLFFRHWPVMFALLFLGYAVRDVLLWCAVWASNIHAAVGMLVFALVPLSMLAAMVLILRLIRPSLPGASASLGDGSPQAGFTAHLASVFVPFLAVYAAFELLDGDRRTYTYRITTEEVFSNFGGDTNIDQRLPFTLNATVITVVATVILVRWLIGINSKVKSWRLIGFVQAYCEVIWMTLAVAVINGIQGPAMDWTEQRRLLVWASDTLNSAIDALGPLAAFGHQVKTWTGNIISSIDTVIVVPIAWLAIGAVIYGHKIIAANRRDELSRQLQRRWNLLPSVAKRVARPLRTDVEDSFTPLVHGLRLIRHAGIRAMLMFCLAFVVAQAVPFWLGELERLLIGPGEVNVVWAPLSVLFGTINSAVGLVLTICLVAAAVDFVLNAQGPADTPAPAPNEPSPVIGQPAESGVAVDPAHPDSSRLRTSGQNEIDRRAVVG